MNAVPGVPVEAETMASVALDHYLVSSSRNTRAGLGRWTCACGELLARVPDRREAMGEHLSALFTAALPSLREVIAAEVLGPVRALVDRKEGALRAVLVDPARAMLTTAEVRDAIAAPSAPVQGGADS